MPRSLSMSLGTALADSTVAWRQAEWACMRSITPASSGEDGDGRCTGAPPEKGDTGALRGTPKIIIQQMTSTPFRTLGTMTEPSKDAMDVCTCMLKSVYVIACLRECRRMRTLLLPSMPGLKVEKYHYAWRYIAEASPLDDLPPICMAIPWCNGLLSCSDMTNASEVMLAHKTTQPPQRRQTCGWAFQMQALQRSLEMASYRLRSRQHRGRRRACRIDKHQEANLKRRAVPTRRNTHEDAKSASHVNTHNITSLVT